MSGVRARHESRIPYKRTYIAALCFEARLPRFTRLPQFKNKYNIFCIAAVVYTTAAIQKNLYLLTAIALQGTTLSQVVYKPIAVRKPVANRSCYYIAAAGKHYFKPI